MKLVWKLLRQHVSVPQLGGFFLANLTGAMIVLSCVQFYSDIRGLFTGEDGLIKKEYLIVTKPISTIGVLTGKSNVFSPEEIKEINRQNFVKKSGAFMPSRFNVTAGVNLEKLGVGFSTEMFFESVPDEYVDVSLSQWSFDEEKHMIPIILPRNYLNLYNFGFAQSRNLPKLSENLIGLVDLDIYLNGNGRHDRYKGRIAGFSNRLNTILVPQQFMEWANRTYAGTETMEPSRLIVEVTNPADEAIPLFFQSKGYETEDGKLDAGKTMWLMKLIISLVGVVGLLICVLSFYILMLSIYLILQKNTTKLENLLLIGYSPAQVSQPYLWLTLGLNGFVFLFSFIMVMILRGYYLKIAEQLSPAYQEGSLWLMIGCGLVLFATVSLFNIIAIRHNIKKLL